MAVMTSRRARSAAVGGAVGDADTVAAAARAGIQASRPGRQATGRIQLLTLPAHFGLVIIQMPILVDDTYYPTLAGGSTYKFWEK